MPQLEKLVKQVQLDLVNTLVIPAKQVAARTAAQILVNEDTLLITREGQERSTVWTKLSQISRRYLYVRLCVVWHYALIERALSVVVSGWAVVYELSGS